MSRILTEDFMGRVGDIMKKPDRTKDKDPGNKAPLDTEDIPDVADVGYGHHLSPPLESSPMGDPIHFRNHLNIPGPNMNFPLHLAAALSPQVYPSAFLGPTLNNAALMSSLSGRGDQTSRGLHHIRAPFFPPASGAPTYAHLHATLAAGDASRHAELLNLLRDSRNPDILYALSQLTGSSASITASSNSGSSFESSPSTSSSHVSPQQSSPPLKHGQEVTPPEKHFSRASSISPSSYMTPRSLNGSPSISSSGATPNYGVPARVLRPSVMSVESSSPASPISGSNDIKNNNNSSALVPVVKKVAANRPERIFPCRICGKFFGYKHVLQNHERTHTGEKPFECKTCKKRFTRDHHLKTHMRLHTGEKPYHCSQCDRQFVQVANLRRHLRVHTGEKPYSCEYCPNKFSDSNQLKAHVLIHKGEKPFTCERCHIKFRRRHHLNHHKCPNDPNAADKEYLDSYSVEGSSINNTLVSYNNYPDNYYGNEESEVEDDNGPTTSTPTPMEEERNLYQKRRGRKSREPRRLVHNFQSSPQVPSPPTDVEPMISSHLPLTPEQTEPEDLSINGSRRISQATYRANIAVTTSSKYKYQSYPLSYTSSPEDNLAKEEEVSMDEGYDNYERDSFPSDL